MLRIFVLLAALSLAVTSAFAARAPIVIDPAVGPLLYGRWTSLAFGKKAEDLTPAQITALRGCKANITVFKPDKEGLVEENDVGGNQANYTYRKAQVVMKDKVTSVEAYYESDSPKPATTFRFNAAHDIVTEIDQLSSATDYIKCRN